MLARTNIDKSTLAVRFIVSPPERNKVRWWSGYKKAAGLSAPPPAFNVEC
jgi:hypothetical protein